MLAFFTSRIAGYLGIALAFVFGAGLAWSQVVIRDRDRTISTLRLDLANTKSDKASLERDVVVLRGSVNEQNAAVAALKAKSDEAEARATKALAGLRDANRRALALSAEIALRMPPVGADVCVAALDEARRPNS